MSIWKGVINTVRGSLSVLVERRSQWMPQPKCRIKNQVCPTATPHKIEFPKVVMDCSTCILRVVEQIYEIFFHFSIYFVPHLSTP